MFVISVDEPLRALAVGPGYIKVVLVVRSGRSVLGQVILPALEIVPVDVQRAAIAHRFGVALWRREALSVLRRACGVDTSSGRPEPTVSVVVCTRDRPDDLSRCLDALGSLSTTPLEVIVVDNCPSDERTRRMCEKATVRYVLEPIPGQSRARNRGIVEARGQLVAFTDDDCVVDPGWLEDLASELADPLVMAWTGYVGPLELDTSAQFVFESHGGFDRGHERRSFHGTLVNPALAAGRVGAGANAIFRREAFERVGLFAEDLGPGTSARAADDNDMFCRILDAGYRIAFDPARVVWHRHRREDDALRAIVFDYGVSSSAFVARRLGRHRDVSALRILHWWWLEHLPRDVAALLARRPVRLPFRAVLGEIAGTLVGPWRLRRSRRSRRTIPELTLAATSAPAPKPALVVTGEWPGLSVVVPTHNRRNELRSVLEELARQSLPAEKIQAVVVLDGSTDDSRELLRTLELPFRMAVVETGGTGVAAARNIGVKHASEPVVLFLDDDTVPEPGCLLSHATAHAQGGEHVALGYCPPVVGDDWLAQMLRAWWEDHYRRKLEPNHRWTYTDFVTGNTSLPRSLLLELGGFDESFDSRHEDWELGIRLLARGVRTAFYPEAIARHHLDASLSTAVLRQRQEGRGDVLLGQKHAAVLGQLPFARFETVLPAAGEQRLERGRLRAERLERLRLRRRWRRQVAELLSEAYVLGVRDELRTDAAFADLVSNAPPLHEVRVPLDGHEPLVLPALGQLEFALQERGETIARVVPIPPGRQWDWAEAIERLSDTAHRQVITALFQRELAEARRDNLEPDVVTGFSRVS